MKEAICPLCSSVSNRKSWFGSTVYRGREFVYLECTGCGSHFCSPMPDDDDLARMYGSDYQSFFVDGNPHSGTEGVASVLTAIGSQEQGRFFDYGCGSGAMLKQVAAAGHEVAGFEYDSRNAARYSVETGFRIYSPESPVPDGFEADFVHTGDVIEHLTDLDRQMPEMLRLLRRGGKFIAQGPLEANPTLFLLMLRLKRLLRPSVSSMPPYHVILATDRGQLKLFERFGLSTETFEIYERAHPAPENLDAATARNPRLLTLFVVSKISRMISAIVPRFGNRYFFVGIKK